MKADNELPIKYTHGSIHGRSSKLYSRVLNGQQIWQRKPHFKQPRSPAQIANQQRFARECGYTGHPDFTKGNPAEQ